ncbi:small multi-drug export protein [Ruminococcus sp.]|uniref:COG2426 family protein n=1 Tax=Ruminococcus sp. TaxID=41978 RepID=UPI002C284238|nr:small multi-drug export protein [Ruminococcus sp.]HOA00163.1 small multi-drug export protein [Ruminococcus sp.]HOH87974.1 small multi-drug export protein [Ruminococcus sp.]
MLKYILTFLISMVPIVELRGGIPIGVSMGVKWYYAVPICMIGNMLPVPFIFFFARKILEWGSDKKFIGKFFSWCLKKGHSGGEKLKAKAGKGMFWALLLFVGIPLPGTGAWTGTLAASLLDLDFKKSIIAVTLGVALAATIMTIATLLGVEAFVAVKG